MQYIIPGCRELPGPRANGATFHLTYAALYEHELNFDFLLAAPKSSLAASLTCCTPC